MKIQIMNETTFKSDYKKWKIKLVIWILLFTIVFIRHLMDIESGNKGNSGILSIIAFGVMVRSYYKMEVLKMIYFENFGSNNKPAQQGVAPEPVTHQ